MTHSGPKAHIPALLTGVLAAAFALAALLPEIAYLEALQLVDHDDSVHTLSTGQIAAVKHAFAALAGFSILLAAWLAAKRERVAGQMARLQGEASSVLRQLRLPPTLPFALILLVAFGVRLAILGGPMRFDEADTFDYFASRSFFNLLTDYTAPNNHILHTALVRASYLVFGHSPPALRLPALIAGMLILPLVFQLTRRLFDEPSAYFAMALAAGQPALIAYSANARGYTIVAACTLAIFLAASFLRDGRNRFAWLVFVMAGAVGMFTIPTMLYPLSAASVWAVWTAPEARRKGLAAEIAIAAIGIAAASVCFYAPAAARTGIHALVANRYVAPLPWPAMWENLPGLARASLALWTDHLSAPVALVVGAAVLAGLSDRASRRLAAIVLGTALVWMAVQRVMPYARVFTYAAPLVCVIAGAGIARLLSRANQSAPLLAPALAAIFAVNYDLSYFRSPTRSESLHRELAALTPRLLHEAGPGTAVYGVIPLSEPIRYGFLTSGRPRGQVLAPDVASGDPPDLEGWKELIVVRPRAEPASERPRRPGYWVDLDDSAFERFSPPETVHRGEFLEVLRLRRQDAP